MNRSLKFGLGPALLSAIFVFLWLSSAGAIDFPLQQALWPMAGDKCLHFVVFFLSSTLLTAILLPLRPPGKLSVFLFSSALCMAASVANEMLQTFSPARDSMSLLDMASDATGYAAGSALALAAYCVKSRRRKIRPC